MVNLSQHKFSPSQDLNRKFYLRKIDLSYRPSPTNSRWEFYYSASSNKTQFSLYYVSPQMFFVAMYFRLCQSRLSIIYAPKYVDVWLYVKAHRSIYQHDTVHDVIKKSCNNNFFKKIVIFFCLNH